MSTMTLQEALERATRDLARGDTAFAEGLARSVFISAPDNPVGLFLSARIYTVKRDWQNAEKAYRRCIKHNPGHLAACINVIDLYLKTGQQEKAIRLVEKLPAPVKNNPLLLINLGLAYLKAGRYRDAARVLNESIEQRRDLYQAWSNLARTWRYLGELGKSLQASRQAIALAPGQTHLQADYYYTLRRACEWETAAEVMQAHNIASAERAYMLPPFISAVMVDDCEKNLLAARQRCKEIENRIDKRRIFTHTEGRKGKIRVGYLSYFPDPTFHLTEALFPGHDRRSFKVHVYASPIDKSKPRYLKRIRAGCDAYVDVSRMDDYRLAEKIFSDEVDILVNLDGHLQGNRLKACALRPAPVQISWLGFPGTTGAGFMDYMITDKVVVPADKSRYYTENLIRLPDSYQITCNSQEVSNKQYTRETFGLPGDFFVYCCFNDSYKIDHETFVCWIEILKRVNNSVLWLWHRNDEAVRNIRTAVSAAGIDPGRIVFSGSLQKEDHLERLQLADAALDTFVCNGHTTTTDALWAGVPVVTRQGNHFSSRVSASLLSAMGLKKLITQDNRHYVDVAVELAENKSILTRLNKQIRRNRLEKPLFDTNRFIKHLEQSYREVFARYRRGEAPGPVTIKGSK